MLKKVLLGFFALVAVLCLVGALLPSQAHVERSITTDRPACTVFAQLDDFHRVNAWSPWFRRDPNASYTFSGPERGVGATMEWASNDPDVGKGSQVVTLAAPCASVEVELRFGDENEPAKSFHSLQAEGAATKVTWGFTADLGFNPIMRYVGLMFDSMIGPDYEEGLANLKAVAEKLPKADFEGLKVETVDAQSGEFVHVSASAARGDVEGAGKVIGEALAAVSAWMAARTANPSGPPLAVTRSLDDKVWEFDVGMPAASIPAAPTEDPAAAAAPAAAAPAAPDPAGAAAAAPPPPAVEVKVGRAPAGRALKAVHKGPYKDLEATLDKVAAYAAARGIATAGPVWEEFVSDPGNTPEAELVTNVYVALK